MAIPIIATWYVMGLYIMQIFDILSLFQLLVLYDGCFLYFQLSSKMNDIDIA